MADAPDFFTDGAAYDRMMGRWSAVAGDAFLDWLALPAGWRWLDVGCGTGAFTELLAARCAPAEIAGIDPSAPQILYARTRPGAHLAQFRQGDAQALPFADDSFDVAVMALVIAFVPDPKKAIAEMTRVVRPGGWIAAYMWDLPAGGSPNGPITSALQSMGFSFSMPPSSAFSQRDRMPGLWSEAGLAAIDTRAISVPVGFADFDEFWELNSVAGPPGVAVRALSSSAREQLKIHLQKRLPKDQDGRISYIAHANAVKGQVPG